jgi:sigma-E factor negative regulatory protein RseC
MIEMTARVLTQKDGIAQIEPITASACGGCQSRSSCGVSGLGKYFSAKRKAIDIRCEATVRAGDEVALSMSEGDLLKAGLLVYLLPSVLALIVAGVAASLGWGDVGAVLGMVLGFVAGFLLARASGWVPRLNAYRKISDLSKGETP